MSGRLVATPRVLVLLPLTVDWQAVVATDLAADRRRLLARAVAALDDAALAVTDACAVATPEEAEEAGVRAIADAAEVVLVVATMAVLPAVPMAAIERLADCPVVLWVVEQGDAVDERSDHGRIVLDGGTVGAPMLASVLTRRGRPFEVVLGPVDDAATIAQVGRAVRAAAAARRIATARVGRIGPAADGYLGSLDLDEQRLHDTIGASVVPIDPGELVQAYADVPDAAVHAVVEEIHAGFATAPELEPDDLARAARAAAALEAVTAEHDLDAGALTCHVEGIRFGPGLGFAPCFALGRLTSRGTPWACSSDLPAAIAMLTLKALGAAAQYHELELVDGATGELLVASSGEHDLAFAGDAPRLVRNGWFPNDAHASACACFAAPAGDATLLGFAQLDAPAATHRFVVASGTFSGRSRAGVGTPHASFRFATGPARTAWSAWCRSGVSLHAACTPGEHSHSIATVARFLGVEVVHV